MGRAGRRAALCLLAALTLAGCVSPVLDDGRTSSAAPPRLASHTPDDAADHAALLRAYGGAYRAAALDAYLSGVVAALARPGDGEGGWTVAVLDSPTVNAFALPSGRIYVTRGLLALADDEAEVAAVIAHEMAHVVLRHADKRDEAEARAGLTGPIGRDLPRPGVIRSAARMREATSFLRFTREQELEADANGLHRLAAAGYDPRSAVRILRKLARAAELVRAGRPGFPGDDIALTHPATALRIAKAAELAPTLPPEGERRTERARYLAAIDGLPFGDDPRDGVVRGRRFVHPRLGVQFEAPPGFALENTPRAVIGATPDGTGRLLFDAVEGDGQDLAAILKGSWSDPIDDGSLRVSKSDGRETAQAEAGSAPWRFRLAAARFGTRTFRLFMASTRDDEPFASAFDATLASIAPVPPTEALALQPQHVALAPAAPGDTADSLAGRMATLDPLRRFLVLNGLRAGEPLRPGRSYKIVVD